MPACGACVTGRLQSADAGALRGIAAGAGLRGCGAAAHPRLGGGDEDGADQLLITPDAGEDVEGEYFMGDVLWPPPPPGAFGAGAAAVALGAAGRHGAGGFAEKKSGCGGGRAGFMAI